MKTNDAPNSKSELRRLMRARLAKVSTAQAMAAAKAVANEIESLQEFVQARSILLFHSLPDEIPIALMIRRWASLKSLYLPRVEGEELNIVAYNQSEPLEKGAFGIFEPQGIAINDYSIIDLAIIPGLAFDTQGNRLGRGRGYYDRLLPLIDQAYTVGIGYSFQLFEELMAVDEWDAKLSAVICRG